MKILRYIIGSLLFVPFFNSCEKVDIATYSGDDGIYFDQQWGVAWYDTLQNRRQNYSLIPFGAMEASDSLLHVKVETCGLLYDYDRPFGVEVVADSTTAIEGEDYELLTTSPTIAAGKNSAWIDVLFHRTERMAHETVVLQLRLIPGEYFSATFTDGTGIKPLRKNGTTFTEYGTNADPMTHTIYANMELVEPSGWNTVQFGTFSKKKFALILEIVEPVYGWTIADFEGQKMKLTRSPLVARLVYPYLMEQYNKGRDYWVIDEDGTMMWINGVSWANGTYPDDMVAN